MKRQFLDVKGVCNHTSLSKSTIYKKVAADEIPHYKVGAKILFDVDEINRWVKGCKIIGDRAELSFLDIKPFFEN